jgi:hypothetical protein|nr:MAG TPA: hypothetical protein [Caudoviricetes sp.]
MEIVANKKSPTLSKFGDSEREASTYKKNFSKEIAF